MSEKSNGTTKTLTQILGWNRTSYVLMSSFALLLFIIGYVWWPLVEEYLSTYNPDLPFWMQFDWLLLSIFLVMSLLLMAKADIKKDMPIIFVGLVGGLVIESWGTQTELWFYYTFERPPLWIIPAWPIASLSIDRLFQLLNAKSEKIPPKIIQISYWVIFIGFYIYMLYFVWPTLDKSLTIGLGYFLELWGTTRYCWTYYTFQTPPFFAILAHGMAAVAFWRVVQLFWIFEPKSNQLLQKILKANLNKKAQSEKNCA